MSDLKKAYRTIMDDNFPDEMTISFGDQKLIYRKRTWKIADEGMLVEKGLRYGENPGQEAAMYELVNGNLVLGKCGFITPGNSLVSGITEEMMIQPGKHPGKINLTDIDACLNILKYLAYSPAVVIAKHNNPCGTAIATTVADAFMRAYMADRVAAFGGCVAMNRTCDRETAEVISSAYFEVVAAPGFAEGAVDILKSRKNLRIIEIGSMGDLEKWRDARFLDFKSLIDGGLIVQQSPVNSIRTADDFMPAECSYKGVNYKTDREPTDREKADMLFGWSVEQGVTSNSVLFVKNGTTVGIGTGEQDRVGVAEIAAQKAYSKLADRLCFERYQIPYNVLSLETEKGERPESHKNDIDEEVRELKGGMTDSAMVSDAFFPFRDGVDVGIKNGISCIVQPGGSLRDFEAITACNEATPKVAMLFTGQRAFKH